MQLRTVQMLTERRLYVSKTGYGKKIYIKWNILYDGKSLLKGDRNRIIKCTVTDKWMKMPYSIGTAV